MILQPFRLPVERVLWIQDAKNTGLKKKFINEVISTLGDAVDQAVQVEPVIAKRRQLDRFHSRKWMVPFLELSVGGGESNAMAQKYHSVTSDLIDSYAVLSRSDLIVVSAKRVDLSYRNSFGVDICQDGKTPTLIVPQSWSNKGSSLYHSVKKIVMPVVPEAGNSDFQETLRLAEVLGSKISLILVEKEDFQEMDIERENVVTFYSPNLLKRKMDQDKILQDWMKMANAKNVRISISDEEGNDWMHFPNTNQNEKSPCMISLGRHFFHSPSYRRVLSKVLHQTQFSIYLPGRPSQALPNMVKRSDFSQIAPRETQGTVSSSN